MNFLMLLEVLFVFLAATVTISLSKERDENSSSAIFAAYPGRVLKNHVFSLHYVTSEFDCALMCLKENQCLSYNYKTTADTLKGKCELNGAKRITCPSCLVEEPEATYYEDIKIDETATEKSSKTEPASFDMTFPSKDVTSYVDYSVPLSVELRRFSLCFWMKTTDVDQGTPFSYANSNFSNALTIKKDFFYIHDYSTYISLGSFYDGLWHHVCLKWTNKVGTWRLVIDGTTTDQGTNLQAGHVVRGGGVLIIGQDQDGAPGDPAEFQHMESFVGSISGVNLWNTLLPPEEILLMSKECNRGIGNFLKWSQFHDLQRFHGSLILSEPSWCMIKI